MSISTNLKPLGYCTSLDSNVMGLDMAKAPTLSDVRARRAVISREIERVISQIPEVQRLREEDKIMEATEKGLQALSAILAHGPIAPPTGSSDAPLPLTGARKAKASAARPRRKKRKNSAEQLILQVMEADTRVWWTAGDLKAAMDEKSGRNNKMTTISPTLTAIVKREDALIERRGLAVGLKARVARFDEAQVSEGAE